MTEARSDCKHRETVDVAFPQRVTPELLTLKQLLGFLKDADDVGGE